MHTFNGESCIIHYNNDFSGEITIVNPSDNYIIVDAQDILKFVAYCYIQSSLVDKIEQMDYKDLLTK